VYEMFRRMRPGVPLAMLHGGMKQMKRFEVFYTFGQCTAMVLFATDIAARGLDFPQVDWVVQADCPEDADAYIHRAGRTARFKSGMVAHLSAYTRCPTFSAKQHIQETPQVLHCISSTHSHGRVCLQRSAQGPLAQTRVAVMVCLLQSVPMLESFCAGGESLLFLMPSEEKGMLEALADKRVPVQRRSFSARKVLPVKGQLAALLAQHEELKQTAQAAFATYMRSVFLNPNKNIFDISQLDAQAYSSSLGLLTVPHQRAIKKMQKQARKIHQGSAEGCDNTAAESSGDDSESEHIAHPTSIAEAEPAAQDTGNSPPGDAADPATHKSQLLIAGDSEEELEDDGDLLTVRRRDVLSHVPSPGELLPSTRCAHCAALDFDTVDVLNMHPSMVLECVSSKPRCRV
jgi:superfamily II DNA/RNA helicase